MNKINVIFDMETSDPDDFITLCFLIGHPKINLVAVTITPGTEDQVGLIKNVLEHLEINIPVGAREPNRSGAVSEFHYKIFSPTKSQPDGIAHDIIAQTIIKYPDTTLLTGGPLQNLKLFLNIHTNLKLNRWIGQGGFAGSNLVESCNQLDKFKGMITCPTFNFNGDPKGALQALSNSNILLRKLVSKNVCHGTLYNKDLHRKFSLSKDYNKATQLIYNSMEVYLKNKPFGKMLHDPLAACTIINDSICSFLEVEMYREKGQWGANKSSNSNTWISVSLDLEKFEKTFLFQDIPIT